MSFSSPLALNFNSHLHLNRSRRILPLTIIKFLSNEIPIRFSLSFSLSRCKEIILLLSPLESLVEELAAATDAFDLGSLSSYQNFSSTLEAPFTTLAICDWPVYIDDDLLLPRASRSVIFSFPNSAKPPWVNIPLSRGMDASPSCIWLLVFLSFADPFENCRTLFSSIRTRGLKTRKILTNYRW